MNKLQGNRAYKEHDPDPAVNGFNPMDPASDHAATRSIRIEVYKGNKYQGKKVFSQDRIIIGSNLEADLVLSDDEITDKHACITYIDDQLVILDQTKKAGLLIKGGLNGISIIDSSEQIGIGPYILNITHEKTTDDQIPEQHIPYPGNLNKEMEVLPGDDLTCNPESRQLDSPALDSKSVEPDTKDEESEPDLSALFEDDQDEVHELYDLVFEGSIQEDLDINRVKSNLVKILKTDKYRIEHFLRMKRVVLKSGLEIDTAKKYKEYFEKSGARCRLTVHSSTDRHALTIQDKEPEDFPRSIPEEDSSEIEKEVQNQTYEEKQDSEYESQIEKENISSDDEGMIVQAHHSDPEISSDSQLYASEAAPSAKVMEIINSLSRETESSDDSMVTQPYHSVTGLSSDEQLQTQNQEITAEEGISVDSVEKPEPINKAKQFDSSRKEKKAVWKFYGVNADDEEDDDEDEDLPADFFLRDRIDDLNASGSQHSPANGKYLEVIKLRGNNVIDINHLEEKEKFFIRNDRGKRFCLAEVKGSNEALFSFDKVFQGNIEVEGRKPVETRLLMKDENCISKRKGIYRTRIPGKGKVLISDGYFDYQMRVVNQSLVPQAPEIKEVQKKSYRHIGVSFAFHIVFLLFLGLFPSFDNGKNAEEETRFVKLDSTQLAELEKTMNPKPKPPEPKPPAVEPEVKKQVKPTTPQKKPVRVASSRKPSKAKSPSRPSRHPDAGGGFGEGNVSTRNINEAGILGMISDSVGIQPKNALAAVTNLDAVSSPNVTSSNLKVGGVVGKIGTGEIAVPKGTIVSTKGSSQVLRSYGRKGEGTVAALEKGKTGEQEVMGMVTATLDKSVRIRGGLSMEAVKRVIDAHLDDITYCYETELIANPSIVGKVMFEWKILMSGEVGEVRIKSSSINSHEIHACIKDAIRTWRFPKPRGSEVMVSYPFVFDIVGF